MLHLALTLWMKGQKLCQFLGFTIPSSVSLFGWRTAGTATLCDSQAGDLLPFVSTDLREDALSSLQTNCRKIEGKKILALCTALCLFLHVLLIHIKYWNTYFTFSQGPCSDGTASILRVVPLSHLYSQSLFLLPLCGSNNTPRISSHGCLTVTLLGAVTRVQFWGAEPAVSGNSWSEEKYLKLENPWSQFNTNNNGGSGGMN